MNRVIFYPYVDGKLVDENEFSVDFLVHIIDFLKPNPNYSLVTKVHSSNQNGMDLNVKLEYKVRLGAKF